MSVVSKDKIKLSDVISLFTAEVTNKVMSGALHSSYNIRSAYGNYVVPYSILGNKTNIPTLNPGVVNSRINANTLYNAMISVTRYLLRVGTYSYHEYKLKNSWKQAKPNGTFHINEWSSSGKALFSDAYARDQIGNLSTAPLSPVPTQSPIVSTHIISASELKALINRCYSSWSSSRRPNYTNTFQYCHVDCYCHKSCHSSCYCNDPHDHQSKYCYSNGTCNSCNDCYDKH